jgi:hypothetical protein
MMGDRRAAGPTRGCHQAPGSLAPRPRAGAPPAFSRFFRAPGRTVACSGTPPRSLSVTGFSNRPFPLGVLAGDDDGRTGESRGHGTRTGFRRKDRNV